MATAQEILGAIDLALPALFAEMVAKQTNYVTVNGRHFQGLKTHSTDPADGAAVPADDLTLKPYYQSEDWVSFFGLPTWTSPFSAEVHQYVGPLGPGWVGFVRVRIGSDLWEKAQGQGPENRDSAWHVVVLPPEIS